jgi:hypothetical protein
MSLNKRIMCVGRSSFPLNEFYDNLTELSQTKRETWLTGIAKVRHRDETNPGKRQRPGKDQAKIQARRDKEQAARNDTKTRRAKVRHRDETNPGIYPRVRDLD